MTNAPYVNPGPTIDEIKQKPGRVVLEFGTDWCGYCKGAQESIQSGLSNVENLTHLKVEDGPGRKLGRHFRVKLWPTLILLQDGEERARVVRPNSSAEVNEATEKAYA